MVMVYTTAIKIHITMQLVILFLSDLAFVNDLQATTYVCVPNQPARKEATFMETGNGWI